MDLLSKVVARNTYLQTRKDPWNIHYQRLAENFLNRKADFTSSITPGDFLYTTVFDNTGEVSALQAASVFMSMLWPDSTRTCIQNRPPAEHSVKVDSILQSGRE